MTHRSPRAETDEIGDVAKLDATHAPSVGTSVYRGSESGECSRRWQGGGGTWWRQLTHTEGIERNSKGHRRELADRLADGVRERTAGRDLG